MGPELVSTDHHEATVPIPVAERSDEIAKDDQPTIYVVRQR
jgi:hypothetical protein